MFLQKIRSFLRVGGDTRSVSTLLFGTSEWHGYHGVWVTVWLACGLPWLTTWVTVWLACGLPWVTVWVTVGYHPYVNVAATSYETQVTNVHSFIDIYNNFMHSNVDVS